MACARCNAPGTYVNPPICQVCWQKTLAAFGGERQRARGPSRPLLARGGRLTFTLRCPYIAGLVEALKARVPWDGRTWDPATKTWAFANEYFSTIKEICLDYFETIDVAPELEVLDARPVARPIAVQATGEQAVEWSFDGALLGFDDEQPRRPAKPATKAAPPPPPEPKNDSPFKPNPSCTECAKDAMCDRCQWAAIVIDDAFS